MPNPVYIQRNSLWMTKYMLPTQDLSPFANELPVATRVVQSPSKNEHSVAVKRIYM